jgi:hypothetical protein
MKVMYGGRYDNRLLEYKICMQAHPSDLTSLSQHSACTSDATTDGEEHVYLYVTYNPERIWHFGSMLIASQLQVILPNDLVALLFVGRFIIF